MNKQSYFADIQRASSQHFSGINKCTAQKILKKQCMFFTHIPWSWIRHFIFRNWQPVGFFSLLPLERAPERFVHVLHGEGADGRCCEPVAAKQEMEQHKKLTYCSENTSCTISVLNQNTQEVKISVFSLGHVRQKTGQFFPAKIFMKQAYKLLCL